jgi:hypothetical protein
MPPESLPGARRTQPGTATVSIRMAGEPPLHLEVEPIAFLLGTWRGEGKGEYPTIEPFAYPSAAVIELRSATIAFTASAKEVRELHRTFRVERDTTTYEVAMAAVGVPLTHHLSAQLSRQ